MSIGFYLHHHGRGHLARGRAIIAQLREPCTVLTSATVEPGYFPTGTEVISLPPDWDHRTAVQNPSPGGLLHWAPLSGNLAKARSAIIADFLQRPAAGLLVCDVSVEVALLARLFGVGVVTMRSHGDREDPAHVLGFETCVGLLAPYPEDLEAESVPSSVRLRTMYAGFVVSDEDEAPTIALRQKHGIAANERLLVIAIGGGGSQFELDEISTAAQALHGWTVVVLGAAPAKPLPNVLSLGWVDNVGSWMEIADLVVGHGGHNLVTEALRAGRPFLCIPEERPYFEQLRRAERLEELGLATMRDAWPSAAQWLDLLGTEVPPSTRPALGRSDFEGARNSAAYLEETHDALRSHDLS